MTWIGLCQFLGLLVLLVATAKPLGAHMARVFEGKPTFLSKALLPLENLIYRLCAVNPEVEQTWTSYAGACLAFGVVNFIVFYALLRIQGALPWNPQRFGAPGAPSGAVPMTPDLAFNVAVSFMTATSWQSYPGETTLSYLSQTIGIGVQSFASAAAGMAVAVAMIRGFARRKSRLLGNFWVDLTRATLYVFLPLCAVAALFLCSQGVIQNFRPYQQVTTLEHAPQTIPLGPVASQKAINLISAGDGGGFFNANSAHPFENPSPVSNLVETFLMLAIPAAMTYTFGLLVEDQRQGWALFAAMMALFVGGACLIGWSEQKGNPALLAAGIDQRAGAAQPGGNMEGKEVRFGIGASAFFSEASTASSDGAVNSMHESFTPLSGLVQMFNLTTGEVIFGGAGIGVVSMILTVMLTVFLAGLMVGRTPQYLGKKLEATEMKLVMISYLATSAHVILLAGAALLVVFQPSGYWNPPGPAVANLANHGPHGLTAILYANASAMATNGSAFAGLNANTPWFNLTLGLEMLIGRFVLIVAVLAIAGNLVRKPSLAVTSGTLPTHGPLFLATLLGAIVLLTALTFFPALSLGPVVEHFLMNAGVTFP
jgi:potassium-transporting ATPase potassium-binding subunit